MNNAKSENMQVQESGKEEQASMENPRGEKKNTKAYRSTNRQAEAEGTTETRESEDNLEISAMLPSPFITHSQTHSLLKLLQNKLNMCNHNWLKIQQSS